MTEQDLKNQVRQTNQAIANKQTAVQTQLFQLRCLNSHISNFIQENDNETESQRQSQKLFGNIAVDEASQGTALSRNIRRLRDKHTTSKVYNQDELIEKYKKFQEYLKAFERQVEHDFDPDLIELQQNEELNLATAAIEKAKLQATKDLATFEMES
jgi:hypothetical protein